MRRIVAWIIISFPLFLLGDFSNYFDNDGGTEEQPTMDKCKTSTQVNTTQIGNYSHPTAKK